MTYITEYNFYQNYFINKENYDRSVIKVVMIKGNAKIDHKKLISILQSCLALILVVLVGLVRGATQRMVKLEITGTQNNDLIAYLDDVLSGLSNKGSCKELLNSKEILREPTVCIMLDLNNLKIVNDTMGHSAGDQLILNFARLLRRVIPEKHFVGSLRHLNRQ